MARITATTATPRIASTMALALTLTLGSISASAADPSTAIDAAVNGAQRTPELAARDVYRQPAPVLEFFGLEPGMSVLEIWPGGAGWYTEILAPLVRDDGQLTVAIFGDQTDKFRDYMLSANEEFRQKLAASPTVYDQVEIVSLWPPGQMEIGDDEAYDMVLTFRNLHNWLAWGQTDVMLEGIFNVLKPGGTFGVIDHRANADAEIDPLARSGYVNQQLAIDLITDAGFEFIGSSELLANPRDTAEHPRGVWTLPPTLAMGKDADNSEYLAIGESDRFVLRFRKPVD